MFLTKDRASVNTVEERGPLAARRQGLGGGVPACLPLSTGLSVSAASGSHAPPPRSLLRGARAVLSHWAGWWGCRRALAEGRGGEATVSLD